MRSLFATVSLTLAGAVCLQHSASAADANRESPIIPLEKGSEVVQVTKGAKVWVNREYQMAAFPKKLENHKIFLRSPMEKTRFEVFQPGYIVVLTPLKQNFNQSELLSKTGFQSVDLTPFNPYTTRPNKPGNLCLAVQKQVQSGDVVEFNHYGIALWSDQPLPLGETPLPASNIKIPTLDISDEKHRHSFVAKGTPETYQGHVDTVLMPDNKTMFAIWAINHAGYLGPLARSDDAGLNWSEPITTPENWRDMRSTTPTIHRLVDPQGQERLFAFAGRNFPGRLCQSYSEDNGKTWTAMVDTGLKAECPPKDILSFDNGKRLVMWCDRRDPETTSKEDADPLVWQSESLDGGLTWSPERVVVKVPTRWAQPAVIRDHKDPNRLVMLLRYNGYGKGRYAISTNNARTWSEAMELPESLTGHRPRIRRAPAPDNRLVVVMRDTAPTSHTRGHFVAWIGTFDDIVNKREGQYRIKLLHSNAGSDTGYSGLEVLPDGTFIATTYVKYEPGKNKHSVVCTRFKLAETDAMIKTKE
jgi:hypothetical protein